MHTDRCRFSSSPFFASSPKVPILNGREPNATEEERTKGAERSAELSEKVNENDLEEFLTMVNFTNPGTLGDAHTFRRHYEVPVLNGREPNATEEERTKGAELSAELSEKVNKFILRRTNALLSNHLPPKARRVLQDSTKKARVLASILALKKLCNHPKLIYDTLRSCGSNAAGFEECLDYCLSEFFYGM